MHLKEESGREASAWSPSEERELLDAMALTLHFLQFM